MSDEVDPNTYVVSGGDIAVGQNASLVAMIERPNGDLMLRTIRGAVVHPVRGLSSRTEFGATPPANEP